MKRELKRAFALREYGEYKESNRMLLQLVEEYPDDSAVNYHCAWSFDVLGEEVKAAPFYEKAISLGLPDEEMQGAIIGLGSTYRAIGQYVKAIAIFERGIALFPENRAMQVFYVMVLHNRNHHVKAMEILLKCVAETTNDKEILKYKKAISF